MLPFKLGRLAPGVHFDPDNPPANTNEIDVEHLHGDVYYWERTTGPSRLVIGRNHSQVDLLDRLSSLWRGPSWLLFVLRVPRSDALPGRYQSPELEPDELRRFLREHTEFLERDARHQLWIKQTLGDGQLVLDEHNLVYAYGPLEFFEDALAPLGIHRGSSTLPVPHVHHFHPEFDAAERAMIDAFEWRFTPLREQDEEG